MYEDLMRWLLTPYTGICLVCLALFFPLIIILHIRNSEIKSLRNKYKAQLKWQTSEINREQEKFSKQLNIIIDASKDRDALLNASIKEKSDQLESQKQYYKEKLQEQRIQAVSTIHETEQYYESEIDKLVQHYEPTIEALRIDLDKQEKRYSTELKKLQSELNSKTEILDWHEENLDNLLKSNLTSIPWLAGMIADFLTYDMEAKAQSLEWGHNTQRLKKVESIREIRADAEARIQAAKEASYQLEYLKRLYPHLEDVLATDYRELPKR